MKKVCKPLLTRWGYVVQCATSIVNNWDLWVKFLKGVYVYTSTVTKEEDLAKKCLETLKDPKLRCELEYLVAFAKFIFQQALCLATPD